MTTYLKGDNPDGGDSQRDPTPPDPRDIASELRREVQRIIDGQPCRDASLLTRAADHLDPPTKVFVFGSNLAGMHGGGAARWAQLHRGAVYGKGVGMQGMSYAIPTKDKAIQTLPLETIRWYVANFLDFAEARSDLTFQLTPIGCGLAGYKPADIAPMFEGAPANVELPPEFVAVLKPQPGGSRRQGERA